MKRSASNTRWHLWFPLALSGVILPCAASANGAMSLALATLYWQTWFIYVIVTIVFEALALGKWLHVSFLQALKCSLAANVMTAIFGGFFSGIISAFLGFYGGRLNPNPFGQTLLLFTLFGSGSAILEAYCWMGAAGTPIWKETPSHSSATISPRSVILRCLAVHLAGVPIGMAVLLLPSRPYPGLEGQVYTTRIYYLSQRELRKALEYYIAEHEALPQVHSYRELLQLLKPRLGRFAEDPGLWAAAYVPDYSRFDTTEKRRNPIEWNSRIAGRKISYDMKSNLWLIRSRHHGYCEGFVLEGISVKRTSSPHELGYDDRPSTVR